MPHVVCELLWIKNKTKDLGFKYSKLLNLHCDNKASIEIVNNIVRHDGTSLRKPIVTSSVRILIEKLYNFNLFNKRINWQIYTQKVYQEELLTPRLTSWVLLKSKLQLQGECSHVVLQLRRIWL